MKARNHVTFIKNANDALVQGSKKVESKAKQELEKDDPENAKELLAKNKIEQKTATTGVSSDKKVELPKKTETVTPKEMSDKVSKQSDLK